MNNEPQTTNPEVTELGTHAFAATDLFKGRKTAPTRIEAPEVAHHTRYDTRTGNYE